MKILIGMPCQSGVVPVPMVTSLLQLHKPANCGFMVVERQRVDNARNALAMECLTKGFDYLFFVDDDNPIPPDTLEKFLEDDKDIIIPPILARNPKPDGKFPMCAFYAEEVVTGVGKIKLYFPIEEFRDTGYLHRIDGGGTGAMLIKRKVLEKLYKKYHNHIFEFGDISFDEIKVKGRKFKRRTMSEDCEFCERSINAGFELWLDDRIRPIHLGALQAIQWRGYVSE